MDTNNSKDSRTVKTAEFATIMHFVLSINPLFTVILCCFVFKSVVADIRLRCDGVKLRDLEAELEAEQRRGRDTQAENRKLSRMLQELRTQSEDDRRAMTELADQVNTLQQRIKTLRRQLEEAVSS